MPERKKARHDYQAFVTHEKKLSVANVVFCCERIVNAG